MVEPRSPGYPGIPLSEAVELARKIHSANRTNALAREAAAMDMGYNGLNGRSAKVLSDLSHYGLLEKAGSGQVRITKLAVSILYPESDDARVEALHIAATSPALFAELNDYFDDGLPSENALRAYLMRNSFASAAIAPIMGSYLETYRALEQPIVSGGHGYRQETRQESMGSEDDARRGDAGRETARKLAPPELARQSREIPLLEGERVIFMDEVTSGQYLKVIASGDVDLDFLDGLEDFANRMKKRLKAAKGATAATAEVSSEKTEVDPESGS